MTEERNGQGMTMRQTVREMTGLSRGAGTRIKGVCEECRDCGL